MEGIQERVGLVHPSCEAYPITIGGNPKCVHVVEAF